jgi:hypothetical protein
MHATTVLPLTDVPVGHIEDEQSIARVLEALHLIHGPEYTFALRRWDGETFLGALTGTMAYRFVLAAEQAAVQLQRGDLVRGPSPGGPYRRLNGELAEVTAACTEALWPGDVLVAGGSAGAGVTVTGRGVYFEVIAPETAYRAPALALLRNLPDRPRGCAAYPGAFRREALPPEPSKAGDDRRGTNRVNGHALDMRYDRTPPPLAHYHGPVPCGGGRTVNHSETALVLPRDIYGLPPVEGTDEGHAIIYLRPGDDPAARVRVPLRPGSLIVTPATTRWLLGHCFENAFAMLVAIPGFVAPAIPIVG